MAPLRWEVLFRSDACEVWKLDKPLPDMAGIATFYRGRLYRLDQGRRTGDPAEEKFTILAEARAWFERHKE